MTPVTLFLKPFITTHLEKVDKNSRSLRGGGVRRGCKMILGRFVEGSKRVDFQEGGYNMGVSLNGGTSKWMVKIMENPIKIGDLGVPLFLEGGYTPTPIPHAWVIFFAAHLQVNLSATSSVKTDGAPKGKDRLPIPSISGGHWLLVSGRLTF